MEWAKLSQNRWTFPITTRSAAPEASRGTLITVRDLYPEVEQRINDGVFIGQLRDAIARTYAFYLVKFVNIFINDVKVEPTAIDIGENHFSQELTMGEVTCAITAGIGIPQGGAFRDRSSGWFIFCNGRSVISADKTALTGWGLGAAGLPIFQPKHRPFIGTVFFVSKDAEKLPWTTKKDGLNEDSAVWQEAKRNMSSAGRLVISFLDGRYTDEGTEIASADLQEAAGNTVSVITAAVSKPRLFKAPDKPPPENIKVQHWERLIDVKKVENYLRRPGMGGAEVGRYTFHYFIKNEVGEK